MEDKNLKKAKLKRVNLENFEHILFLSLKLLLRFQFFN